MVSAFQKRNSVFISYSHQDRRQLDELLVHLQPLKREHGIEVWSDTQLKAGDNWRREIRKALDEAKVALVLVSASFRASEFITNNELPPLLVAASTEGLVIIPIIVGACDFDNSELAGVQAINPPSKPLNSLRKSDRDGWYTKVTQRVKEVIGVSGTERLEPQSSDESSDDSVIAVVRDLSGTNSKSNESTIWIPSNESAADLLQQAQVLAGERRYSQALPMIERVVRLSPLSVDAWKCFGWILIGLRRFEDALPALDQAIALRLTDAVVWADKGMALDHLNRNEEALSAYRRARTYDPSNYFAWLSEGSVLLKLERYQEALEAFDHALALDESDSGVWTLKGQALESLGRYQEAMTAAERAVDLDPLNTLAQDLMDSIEGVWADMYADSMEDC